MRSWRAEDVLDHNSLRARIRSRRQRNGRSRENPFRRWTPEICDGKPSLHTDLRPPGMLYGKVLRPPSFGATLASYDDMREAKAMTGVVLVRDGDFVGAAAPTAPKRRRPSLPFRRDGRKCRRFPSRRSFRILKKNAAANSTSASGHAKGSVDDGLASAAHSSTQPTPSLTSRTRRWSRARRWPSGTDGKLTVWTGTQRPFGVRDELAGRFHLPEEKVRVIVPDTGSAMAANTPAMRPSKPRAWRARPGKPVKLVWTREEEFTWAYFRPAGVIEVKSGIASGRHAHRVGFSQLQFRRLGDRNALRHCRISGTNFTQVRR